MANQYTSYYLYQKYEKRGSQDWLPCYPNIFSVDGEGTMPLSAKTVNDPECGYKPPAEPIYRWYNMPITTDYVCDVCPAVQYRWINKSINVDYECVGTDKYYVQKRQYSYDSGSTWNDVVPEETQRGSLYESDSTDCGYIPPIEPQYRTISGVSSYCNGYDLYDNVYSQVSYDGGVTWETTATTPTLVESNSPLCGYIEPQYRTTSGTPYCEDTDKYVDVYSQVSYDDGLTWETTATTSSLTEACSSDCIAHIQPIDMTGKLYIGKYYDGSTHRSYNCSSDPVQMPNLIAPETTGYQDKNVANTGAFGTGIDPYIYIGSCPHSVAAYAFRSYGNIGHKCGVSFYFDSGLTSFCFSTGALIATNVREVVLGNSSMTFSAGDEAFSGASGDISVITSRLTSAGENCFMEGNFGDTVTFDKTITLYNKAFYWTNFETIVFNSGFTIGSSSIQETFFGKYGATYTIVLNGSMEDYDNPNIADILRGYGHTVIDNRPQPAPNTKLMLTYSGGNTYSAECNSTTSLSSGDTRPSGYQYTAVTYAYIGDCITVINGRAFYGFKNMTGVTIPDSVTAVRAESFADCSGLTNIYLSSGLTNIGESAFQSCAGLTSIDIPDSVTSIGDYTFSDCGSLTSCTIGSGVTSIGSGAFLGCGGLANITVSSNNSVYDSRSSCNGIVNTSTNALILGCKNTVIPNTVTSISGSAFYGCTSLTSIEIPNNVTSIGNNVFAGCSGMTSCILSNGLTSISDYTFYECISLTNIDIPSGVTRIGGQAFQKCVGLTSVTISSNVTNIGGFAFYNCSGLTSVTVEATTPPTLGGNYVFDNTNNCPIYVPAASVNSYKTANRWSTYASRIQAIP